MNWNLKVRVVRFWTTPDKYKPDIPYSMELILQDEKNTIVTKLEDSSFHMDVFKLRTFDEVAIQHNTDENQLIDVVGHVVSYEPIQLSKQGDNNSSFMNIVVEDEKKNNLPATLWGDLAFQMQSHLSGSTNEPLIVVLQLMKTHKFRDTYSIRSCWYQTKLWINTDLPQSSDFKNKLIASGEYEKVSQTSSQQHVSISEELSTGMVSFKFIKDFLQCTKESSYWIAVKIVCLELGHKWSYLACKKCITKVLQLIGKTAKELKEGLIGDADNGYPTELDTLIEKKLMFKVQIKDSNINKNDNVYKVVKFIDDEALLKEYCHPSLIHSLIEASLDCEQSIDEDKLIVQEKTESAYNRIKNVKKRSLDVNGKHIMVDENAFSVEHSNVQSNEQNIYENEYEDMLEGDEIEGSRIYNQDYWDMGDPTYECEHCGAYFWYEERIEKRYKKIKLVFTLCCGKGKIKLPNPKDPPTLLNELLFGSGDKSRHFRENIRNYNSMFSFTSMGGKIDASVNQTKGPRTFRLSGQNYHKIGSLLPTKGFTPKFAQLYIYDTENEVQNRINVINRSESNSQIHSQIVNDLKEMLDQHNVLTKSFRMVRDRFQIDQSADVKLRLIGKRRSDGRRYNLPTVSKVAALVVGDFEPTSSDRDIIIESHFGQPKRISELNAAYLGLQYPLLFPFGEDGYREDIPLNGIDESSDGRKYVSSLEYFSYKIQERKNEVPTIVSAKRLFQQFLVDGYTMIESSRLLFYRLHQTHLRADFYKGLQEAVLQGDTQPSSKGQRVILSSSFTGGTRYMLQNYQDAMSICKWAGYPDLFITFTCNPKWPEITKFVNSRGLAPEDRPDIITRVFKVKLDHLIKDLRDNKVFGQVKAGLLDDDKEYVDAIVEASHWGMPSYLRQLFAMLLISNSMSRPEVVWQSTWHLLSEYILHEQKRVLDNPGKTYIWKTLSATIRSKGDVVLTVASSGIASLLLPGGRTAHSRFVIPLNITEDSTSLDKTLRDIIGYKDATKSELLFGGKTIVLGGDFRRILPVIPKGSRQDIVNATLNFSYLWPHCELLTLTKNMRLQNSDADTDLQELQEFSDWILAVGDGSIGNSFDGIDKVLIPKDLLITEYTDPIAAIVESMYPDFSTNCNDVGYLQQRAIFAPTLDMVESINQYMISLNHNPEKSYLSSDKICKSDHTYSALEHVHTLDFLNTIKCSGVPNHSITLKVGVLVMLLRNIDQAAGLCNGTRLIVTKLGNQVIEAKVLSGQMVGQKVFIPRMTLTPSDARIPFKFQRRQFPITVSFAMTINKSQGQSLSHVGLFLKKPVFTHGQLYVAVSKVTSRKGLKILSYNYDGQLTDEAINSDSGR
ncbi:hypothetical protein KY289_018842 [Solanum tuberosum]|nr:hypothetical protein KY289_018842 [Solanum tuberosum]